MKNINKVKPLNHNFSSIPFKLSSQKAVINSKSTSLNKNKKQKQYFHSIKNQKAKAINEEYFPQQSKPQTVLNPLQKYERKKQVRLTVPYLPQAVNYVSDQKITQKNSKSISKFVKKPLKNQSEQQKVRKDQIKKQVKKKININAATQYKIKQQKSSLNNLEKHKSLINGKTKSKSTKKSFKSKNDCWINLNKKSNLSKVVKSSCITRNVSKNNSKQKQYKNAQKQLNQKFKKKNLVKGGLEKKTKLTHIYSSMKISPRNSFKCLQTKSNEFLILGEYDSKNQNPQTRMLKACQKSNNSNVELKKMKSEKNIYQRLKEYVDSKNESFLDCKQDIKSLKKIKQFSFLEFYPAQQVVKSKQNQLSIELLLQATDEIDDINFMQCHENQHQKLNLQKEVSLKRVKQEQFSRLQNMRELNIYEDNFFRSRSYSISSQLCKIAQQNNTDFTNIFIDRNSTKLKQRIQIVDWMSILSSQLLLKTQTYHLAVAYYDIYLSMISKDFFTKKQPLSQHQKQIHQLKLIGIGCLLIAIKMDERQYEFDILKAIMALETNYQKNEIVRTEFQILKKLRLKLKIQTLTFWLDYLSLKWDQFILNCQQSNTLVQIDRLLLRSVDGRSYQNYRKITSILNIILLDGGIFNHGLIEIVLSVFYTAFSSIISQQFKSSVLSEINCLGNNIAQNSEFYEKQTLKNYATRDTLDQLSQSDLKENSPQYCIQSQQNNKINRNENKKQLLQFKLSSFQKLFQQFAEKITKKYFTDLQNTIKYTQKFSELQINSEMDQRIYEEARNYQEFIRYHNHLLFAKQFVLENLQSHKTNQNFHNFSSQQIFHENKESPTNHSLQSLLFSNKSSQNDNLKNNSNLDQLLFQKVQRVFVNHKSNQFSL